MNRNMTLDIHDYDRQYTLAEAWLRASAISAHNKDLIIGYRDACLLQQVCGKVRLIRAIEILVRFAQHLGKDFDQATREDIQRIVTAIMADHFSPSTVGTYKAVLKRFMGWLLLPNDFPKITQYPAIVSWMTCHVRKRDERHLERRDLITPQDIERLLGVCQSPRDRALISMLWETGARVAELGNLQLKHITRTAHGFTLDLNGKTGHRTPLIVSSAPYLAQWLASHPFRNDPESPLWVLAQYTTTPRHVRYASIRQLLRRYFLRAGITKPFNPHAFRHGRATYVLANSIMSEATAKLYFGWTPDSGMLATYSHLVDQDANNAILRENSMAPEKQIVDDLKPIPCRICNELNPPGTQYCTKCGAVLNLVKAYEHQQAHQLTDDVVISFFRVLVERGLVTDAARAVHEAGLGDALKCLAAHTSGEEPLGAIVPRHPSLPLGETRSAPEPLDETRTSREPPHQPI